MTDNPLYSIIIPHKNIPDLLCRCLDSIPRRDDVQIIVVDDKSDPKQVDFKNFPGLNDKNVEVYFTKKSKGAGYARNVGLEHAKGKWVLFADADDVFLDNMDTFLDKCKDLEFDAIIFNYVYKSQSGELCYPNQIETNNPRIVFPNKCFPWCKIIRKNILDFYKIRFQEVPWSNDLMFAAQLAKYSKNIYVSQERVYMNQSRPNSLCTGISWRSMYCRTKVALKGYVFLKKYTETHCWRSHYMDYWKELFHMKKFLAALMVPRICFAVGFRNAYDDIYQRLKIDYPKYFR